MFEYFWSSRRDPKLFPKVVEMIDYYHMKAKEPQAWAIPSTSEKLIRDITSTNASTKFKYGRNMRVELPYDDEALAGGDLRKLLPLLTPENEIDLVKARREMEGKKQEFFVYVFVKDQGKTVIGFWSPKPVDSLAQTVARFNKAESVYRVDDPPAISLLRKLPKLTTSNHSRITLGILTSRGDADAYYAHEIKPLLTQNLLREDIDESEIVPAGECFSYANQLAMKLGNAPDTFVVHATVKPGWHHRAYAHAWVETRDRVFDWQAATFPSHKYHKTGWPKQLFYDEFQPRDVKRYTPEDAIVLMLRHHHQGPWPGEPGGTKKRHLKVVQNS
jgi:hypothetical protein